MKINFGSAVIPTKARRATLRKQGRKASPVLVTKYENGMPVKYSIENAGRARRGESGWEPEETVKS